jgi:competence protein ComEC
VEAVALGEGGGVARDVRFQFGVAGLAHVLAVSGLHFGVVAWAVWWAVGGALRRWGWGVRRWGVEAMAAAVAGPALGVYVVFVGAPVSARRAFIMVTCVLLGRALRREGHGVIGLSAAGLVILGWEPQALHQVGFQLSFAAVLGIFWGAQAWDKPLQGLIERRCRGWTAKALGWAASMGVATAAASVATTPLVLWHFGRSPWVGLVANAWVVPWVSFVVLPVGLAGALVWWLWGAGGVALMKGARLAERAMVWSVEGFVERAPWVSVEAPGLPGWLLCLIGALAVTTLRVGAKPWAKRALGPLALAVGVGVAAVVWGGAGDAETLTVTFLSVGQGDATLIEAPNGEAWLIDAGGARSWDPGERVVVPALYAMGRRRLDHVVVTHPDLDHFGGMAAVVRAMRPHTVWTCGVDDHSPQYQDMLKAAGEVGAQVRPLTSDHPEVALGDGAILRVLWPDRPDPSRGKNDNSVVIQLTHGEVSFLLPGDLEAGGEAALLREGQPISATVLKAGHHGSQTSSTEAFLDAVKPQVVIYSVGADNAFGLPHPDVVERYTARGVVGYRTDRDGAIQMTSDGGTIQVKTWSP